MELNFLITYLLAFSSILPFNLSSSIESTILIAKSVKILMQAIAKPGYLTAITCWNPGDIFDIFCIYLKTSIDISINFYVAFNDVNATNFPFVHQILISNTVNANLPETMDEHYEFVLIDLHCNNSINTLLNADKKLQNIFWIVLNMNAEQVRCMVNAGNSILYSK